MPQPLASDLASLVANTAPAPRWNVQAPVSSLHMAQSQPPAAAAAAAANPSAAGAGGARGRRREGEEHDALVGLLRMEGVDQAAAKGEAAASQDDAGRGEGGEGGAADADVT